MESHKLFFLILLRSEFNYCFVVHVDDFAYNLVITSSALKYFICGEEGHLARAYPSRPGPATCAVAPKVPRLITTARHRWFVVEGDPAGPDRWMESQVGGKRNGVR